MFLSKCLLFSILLCLYFFYFLYVAQLIPPPKRRLQETRDDNYESQLELYELQEWLNRTSKQNDHITKKNSENRIPKKRRYG